MSKANIAFIGAGSYAQSNLLPNLPSDGEIIRYFVPRGPLGARRAGVA